MSVTNRAYVFTVNNPVGPLLFTDPRVRYAVWQRELAPTSGTPHFQGYLEFKSPMRRPAVLVLLPPGAHVEPRNGTRDQARDYCRKVDTRAPGDDSGPFEYGEWTAGGAGTRSDLDALKRRLDEGASEEVLADEMFGTWSRNYKVIERYDYLLEYYFN